MARGELQLPWPPAKLSPNGSRGCYKWGQRDDDDLRHFYAAGLGCIEISARMGRSRSAVRNRAYKLGITRDQSLPNELIAELKTAYERAGSDKPLGLTELAKKWGKSKACLCRKARLIGLPVNQKRRKVEHRKDRRKYGDIEAFRKVHSRVAKAAIEKHGHNRGMLGKRHSQETKDRLRASSKARWERMSDEEREAHTTKALLANIAKNGSAGAPPFNREGASWKAGWREIGGKRIYFRSRWEANYARYLEWLKDRGDILDWEYEPETFWFDKIKRGVRSYKPDFRVHELDGSKPLHEVKGWMDSRSKTTLKRMAKYHPHETIILIRDKEYRAISRFSAMIGEWE